MAQAIPTLKKVNEIRKSNGLREFKWSAYETAMAQAAADYNVYSPWAGHVFNDGAQNMTTGYDEPTQGWYTAEKQAWDAAVAKNPSLVKYIGNSYQLSQDDPDLYNDVGHYLNVIDPSLTDFGGAVAWGGNAQGFGDNSQRVQNYNNDSGDLTVDEYATQLSQYMNGLKNANSIYQAALDKSNQASSAESSASTALNQATQEAENASAKRKAADSRLQKAEEDLAAAQRAYDDAMKQL